MKTAAALASLACLISLQAHADCVEPKAAPTVPDGATASREDMVSAMTLLKSYDSATKEYIACLEKVGGNPTKQAAASERVQKIADKFNGELRTFKKRSG
jgi:hypothetical protein